MTRPGVENEILRFHDFPGFPYLVRVYDQTIKVRQADQEKNFATNQEVIRTC